MIGLDTTAIIDLFKGDPRIKSCLEENKEPLASTHINYLELLFGIDTSIQAHRDEKTYYDDLFSELTVLPLDETACKTAADIFWALNRKGETIGKFDSIIGGILLAHGVSRVITRNVKHFEGIPGMKVIPY